jgi:hypothetical protein
MEKRSTLMRRQAIDVEAMAEDQFRDMVEGLAAPLVRLQGMLQHLVRPLGRKPAVRKKESHDLIVAAGRRS